MHGNSRVRLVGVRRFGVYGALWSLLGGCGSHVIVAEQKREDTSLSTADGGETQARAGTHITLCGNARCKDLSVPIPGNGTVTGYACCADAGASKCGVVEVTQCVQLDYPGHVDSSCHSFPLSGIDLPGCCRPDGTCGVLDTQFGLGCTQLPFVPSSLTGTCTY